jgi:hypothetical protein
MPVPTATTVRVVTPRLVTTPRAQVIADTVSTPVPASTSSPTAPPGKSPASTAEPTATLTGEEPRTPTATSTPTPMPTAVSFLEQRITNLFDLARLPLMEGTLTTQFTSRNWVSREHFFDYFVDDGNFTGPHYGYLDNNGGLHPYEIVPGYDGKSEYQIVPRVPGPGSVDRIWFAYQQHQSVNNPKDMSQVEEWSNWGNLGEMGNIRFYFDDEPTPRIDFGIKDLFVGKNPFLAPLTAFYATANGGNINYVPVPFQRSIRITTTGRPRLMQIQVKRFDSTSILPQSGTGTAMSPISSAISAPQDKIGSLQSFNLNLSPAEQSALDQAAQAWQSCTPALPGELKSYPLLLEPDNSAEVDFNQPATVAAVRIRLPREREEQVGVQVFWDGQPEPSINAPLRALFGTAERLLPYRSLPLGIFADGNELVFYNNIPMPFRSARFVFLNHGGEPLPLVFQAVAHESYPGTEGMRLHAFWGKQRMIRREDEADNYTLIDIQGSGKYLGAILSAWDLDRDALNGPLDKNWRFPYLESNMDVWVDDHLALPGTGIEDDFNAGFYYVYAGYAGYKSDYCLSGVTLLDYSTPLEPSSQYRFYLNDAPEFHNHLNVQVQHGNKGNNLSVTYSSTAFWYQMR